MNIVIDTNRYRDFCDHEPIALDQVQIADHIFLSYISLAELRAGFLCGSRARENERILNRFLNSPRVSVLYLTEQTIRHYAQIFYITLKFFINCANRARPFQPMISGSLHW